MISSLTFPATEDGRKAANAFADKCLAEYFERTGCKADQWCELTLERKHPNKTVEALNAYEVPIDEFCLSAAMDELSARNIADKAKIEEQAAKIAELMDLISKLRKSNPKPKE